MGQPKKKGQSGAAVHYISRAKALKKLQLSLKDFRRLCILKGIYPHEPKNKKKVGKGSSALHTYYYLKDIQFLSHEPLINKFRYFKVFMKRLKRATDKREYQLVKDLRANKPRYKLDHIVKERYPSFVDAIRDMDDSLALCNLFATFPKSMAAPINLIGLCRRLTIEFMHYVIESRSLRKVFISIKGFYFQADIQGQPVTWIVPHQRGYQEPTDVDYKILATFVEFYTTMMGFVNFRLYNSMTIHYPPKLSIGHSPEDKDLASEEETLSERVGALNQSLNRVLIDRIADDAEVDEFPTCNDPKKIEEIKLQRERVKNQQKLFAGLKFFVGREVPREQIVFIIRCFGGEVSWDKLANIGATYSEDDQSITHQIVDRPVIENKCLSRYYVQPQWLFDCVNGCTLLPVAPYFPGAVLPPHLSPFVEEEEGDYVPPEKQVLRARQAGEDRIEEEEAGSESGSVVVEEEDSDSGEARPAKDGRGTKRVAEEDVRQPKRKAARQRRKKARMGVEVGKVTVEDKKKKAMEEAAEEKRLAVMMIPKKNKRLYEKIVYGKRRKLREATKLKEKRETFDKEQKLSRKRKGKAGV